MEETSDDLYKAADAAHSANMQGVGLLSQLMGDGRDPTLTMFLANMQLALSSNDSLVSRMEDRLREVEGELEFRRSVDDFGTGDQCR